VNVLEIHELEKIVRKMLPAKKPPFSAEAELGLKQRNDSRRDRPRERVKR